MKNTLILICMLSVITGCRLFGGGKKKATAEPVAAEESSPQAEREIAAKNAKAEEIEAKLAGINARIEELEQKMSKQKQRLAVLEKGLLLGVVPDELKNDLDMKTPAAKKTAKLDQPIAEIPKILDEPDLTPVAGQMDTVEVSDPEKALAEGQKMFEQGQYGRAIAIYSTIRDEADTTHRYWIGVCWMKLKEYDSSYKELTEFIAKSPDSPWLPRAKYYLAQIDYELGYREKAMTALRKVIELYPSDDSAQMARTSIDAWEKNL